MYRWNLKLSTYYNNNKKFLRAFIIIILSLVINLNHYYVIPIMFKLSVTSISTIIFFMQINTLVIFLTFD